MQTLTHRLHVGPSLFFGRPQGIVSFLDDTRERFLLWLCEQEPRAWLV